MIRHILFPVDFSEPCARMGSIVRKWAEVFEARVTLLYVVETVGMFTVEGLDLQSEYTRLKLAIEPKLSHYLEDEFAGIEVYRAMTDGQAASSIVDYAAQHKVDLIMMPTMGYTRFRQMLLGSVTAGVLHDSERPVWTCTHSANPVASISPKHILCGVDCGPDTAKVILWGRHLAAHFGATLKVVHSRPVIDPRFDSGIAERAHQLVITTALEDYANATKSIPDAPPLEIIEGPTLAAGIQSVVEREHADLLVISRGKIHGFMGRLRANSHDLIRLSGCPVFSF